MTIFKVLYDLLVKGRELCVYKVLTWRALWHYARTSAGVFLLHIIHLEFFMQLYFVYLTVLQVDWNNLLKLLSLFSWIYFLGFGNCLPLFKQSLGHVIFVTSDSSGWAPKMGFFQRNASVHRVTAENLGTTSSSSWENFFVKESAAVKMCMSRPDQLIWGFLQGSGSGSDAVGACAFLWSFWLFSNSIKLPLAWKRL